MRALSFKSIPAFFVLITISSCSFIARTANDARKPRIENSTSIQQWMESNHFSGYPVMTVAPEAFIDAFVFYMKRKFIFNRDGKIAELGTNNTGVVCYFNVSREIQELEPGYGEFSDFVLSLGRVAKSKEDYRAGRYVETIDTTYFNLDSLNEYVCTIDGTKSKIVANDGIDYVVVIPFARYLGRTFQTSDIRRYLRAIRENKKSTFQVIFLNLDKQDWWSDEWKRMNNIMAWAPSR